MTWSKRHLGIDAVDLVVQGAVTALGVGIIYELFGQFRGGMIANVLAMKGVAISLLVFAWRRSRNLRRMRETGAIGLDSGQMAAARFDDMDRRVNELETMAVRVAELEERLDFTERMLARGEAESARLMGGPS